MDKEEDQVLASSQYIRICYKIKVAFTTDTKRKVTKNISIKLIIINNSEQGTNTIKGQTYQVLINENIITINIACITTTK